MPRTRRYIESGSAYELCLRVRKGLPFPAWKTISLILDSCLARAQRDFKVTVCDYLWMGNHLHFELVAWDAQQCVNFYQELQKKITDAVKRLLGLKYLNLWEGKPSLIKIADLDAMIDRIAYLYANPARANLVDNISQYPHLSTWGEFTNATELESVFTKELPWIRLPKIPKLPNQKLSTAQDEFFASKLRKSAKHKHTLEIHPNAWMRCFGVKESEVRAIKERIVKSIEEREAKARLDRGTKGVAGAYRLRTAAITWDHEPKEKTRRIYIISSSMERRVAFIAFMKNITRHCARLYRQRVRGVRVMWPPGIFVPWCPPRASALAGAT